MSFDYVVIVERSAYCEQELESDRVAKWSTINGPNAFCRLEQVRLHSHHLKCRLTDQWHLFFHRQTYGDYVVWPSVETAAFGHQQQ